MLYQPESLSYIQIYRWSNYHQYFEYAKQQLNFLKFAKILFGRVIKQRGLINHMKKALLKLFNSHEEYFIKFGKTNDYILNKLLWICKL